MSNKAVMAVCTLAMATLASPQQPHLQPRVILPGEGAGRSFWLLAPDIAIVRIQRAQRQGPDIVITPHHKLTVHLVAVDAEVEDTIQGQLPKGPTRFYFFTNSLLPGYSYTTPLSWFYPGKRSHRAEHSDPQREPSGDSRAFGPSERARPRRGHSLGRTDAFVGL